MQWAGLCSYILAEESQGFITTVVSGYDIVPRMTIRGLGHFALSVRDLINNSDDTKQNVLCCIDCKDPEVDAATVLERQERDLFKLGVKRPGTIEGDGEGARLIVTNGEEFQLGRHLVDELAKLGVTEENRLQRLSSDSSEENKRERHAMMFTPGQIMHLEVEKVDMLKK